MSEIQMITKRHGESTADMCRMCFRNSWKVTEAGMQPDIDLVHEMLDRGIRVQDLLYSLFPLANKDPKVEGLIQWYANR